MRSGVLAVTLLAAIGALGEATDCLNPNLGQADNRIVTSHFAGSSNGVTPTYWYAFYGQAGHSYSAEFVATTDNENMNTSIGLKDLYVWGPLRHRELASRMVASPVRASPITLPSRTRQRCHVVSTVQDSGFHFRRHIPAYTSFPSPIPKRKVRIRIGSSTQRCSTLAGAHGQASTRLGASPICPTCR